MSCSRKFLRSEAWPLCRNIILVMNFFLIFLKLLRIKITFSRFDLIYFQILIISFVKRKASSTIEQQKCKGHKKRDQLLVLKEQFNYYTCGRQQSVITNLLFF